MRTYLIRGYRRWQLLESACKRASAKVEGTGEMVRPGRDGRLQKRCEHGDIHSRLSGGVS